MKREDYENINLEEYENIDISLDEVKKHKIKKELRLKVAEKAKSNKKKYIIVASLVGFITLGIISQPVLAEQIPALGKLYEAMGFKSVEKSIYIGQSIIENGVEITLENIACSKNKALIAYRVEANKEFIDNYKGEWPCITPLPNNHKGMGGSTMIRRVSDTELLFVSDFTSQTFFEVNGDLKIQISSSDLNIDRELNLKVDFKELVNNSPEIELQLENPKDGLEIKSLQTTPLGSILVANENSESKHNRKLLKVGNRIFISSGAAGLGENMLIRFNTLLTNNVLNGSEIYLLKDNFYDLDIKNVEIEEAGLTKDEIDTKIEAEYNLNVKEKDSIEKVYYDGISYPKGLTFESGNKAEISNCEKRDGKIYFDIKGTRESEAWALANGIYLTDINNKYNTQLRPNYFEIIDGGYKVEIDDILEGDVKLVIDPFTEKYYERNITEELKLNIK